MKNIEGVTTPPPQDVLERLAEILREAGYTVTAPVEKIGGTPARVRDRDGDTWYLGPNGKYSLVEGREGAYWTLVELQDPAHGLAPIKVIDAPLIQNIEPEYRSIDFKGAAE